MEGYSAVEHRRASIAVADVNNGENTVCLAAAPNITLEHLHISFCSKIIDYSYHDNDLFSAYQQ